MANINRNLILSLSSLSLLSLYFLLSPSTSRHHHHRYSRHFNLPSNLPNPFPPPPKIAYFISGFSGDVHRIFRLLQATYHPRNYYLLHLDYGAPKDQRELLAGMVGSVEVFAAAGNVNVVENASPVRDEGSTNLAMVLHGAAILLRWKRDWDWFVNLDASDYPLLSQDDFLHILSFVPRDFNFIEHTNNVSSNEYQRIVEIVVDPGTYLMSKGKMFTGNKKRTVPDAYQIFTGSPHVILSRKFVEFSILGWDNFPRTLLMYFTNTKFSSRGYFQTLACNSKEFSNSIVNSNLRFIDWDDPDLKEPRNLERSDLDNLLNSGAAFAGKFPINDPLLDAIDLQVLHRYRNGLSPGGWCLGRTGWGRDSCREWGDPSVLRPGPGAKRLEKLLKTVMDCTALLLNVCK